MNKFVINTASSSRELLPRRKPINDALGSQPMTLHVSHVNLKMPKSIKQKEEEGLARNED